MQLDSSALAALVDHTLLKPEATADQVQDLINQAQALGAFSVCVSPSQLPVTVPAGLKVATVVGFPSGAVKPAIKAAEAAQAVADGADEIDMVIDISQAVSGNFEAVEAEIRAVRQACEGRLLKVIIESAALSDQAIVACCQAAEAAGADYVKTSTGFHPAGGASLHAVELMAQTVGPRLGVKASGGIRSSKEALAMVEAGATRLGLSATASILQELED
ncbi:MAG: deoxyribose-phosphate aldolase [Rothia sp. (in: high G+C Gram-positive bacteria)]|nr:deoxyribose-phosphate aldolase [Rothia sp. (in: high G+C Gram-positive bacteria)]